MNCSYACYVTYKTNTEKFSPAWMKAERYDFCESVTRFFFRLKK